MSERIGLSLEPPSLRVEAGGETAAVVVVENRGTRVEQFVLSLEGLETGWYDLSRNAAELLPGEKAHVRARFHVPETTEMVARLHPFSVTAKARSNLEESSTVEGSLEVAASGAAAPEPGLEETSSVEAPPKEPPMVATTPGPEESGVVEGPLKVPPLSTATPRPWPEASGGGVEAPPKEPPMVATTTGPGPEESRVVEGPLKVSPLGPATPRPGPEASGIVEAPPKEPPMVAVTPEPRREESTAAGPRPTAERTGLLLEPSSLQALPGAEAEATLTVENRGRIIDRFSLSLEGLEPGWYDLPGTVSGVLPGEKAQVLLKFHLPQNISVTAGPRPFIVTASSLSNPEETAIAEGSLEVLAFGTRTMEMSPTRLEGRRGVTQLVLRNVGNAPADLSLHVTDLEEGLDFRLDPETASVPAGGETNVSVTLWPKKRPLFGEPREYPFQVAAVEAGRAMEEPELTAEGAFVYKPRFATLPRALGAAWARLKPVLPLLLSLLAVALGLLAFFRPPPAAQSQAHPGPLPVIQAFRSEAGPGGAVRLIWQVEGAQRVTLDGAEVAPGQGSRTIDRPESKEYVLEASSPGGTVRQRLGVVVLKPPSITAFEASPASVRAGGAITLTWKVENATSVVFDGLPVVREELASGKREIRPDQSRDYVLLAENEAGWVVRRVAVRVTQP